MAADRSRLRDRAEYVVARSLLCIGEILPAAALAPFSRGLGGILHRVLKGRRRVVRDNLRFAFGDGPEAPDAETISRSSFSNLCQSFMELAQLTYSVQRMRRVVRFRDAATRERLEEILATGPVVFAASHYGAYEIAGLAAGVFGVPLTTLMRPLDNPWLDRYLNGIRQRFGQRMVSNRGGARELMTTIERGRSAAVLIDLNMKRKRIFVDFFGRPAATAPTAARVALRCARPLVPIFAEREAAPMHFIVDVGEPVWPDPARPREEEIHRLLQAVTAQLEERVRRAPERWLWTHRRWKTRPEEPR